MNDIERLLILNMVEDLGSVRTQALLKHFGSLARIFGASEDELKMAEGIGPKIAPKIIQSIKEIKIDKELGLIKQYGIKIITFLDKGYPKNLKNIYDPPVVLYVKGGILPEDDAAIAIVGSRLASFYGLKTSEKLGYELASRGITVVSGMARGIDSSAHNGALKAKGRTLAVLGSGLLDIYPDENIELAERIAENGAVISEFPMRTIPDPGNFPKRNRIISGLSLGTVVVEAAQKSGALITADCALEQGRDVFSVPGKVDSTTSKGTNRLIKQGAKLAETVHDILEELNLDNLVGCQNDNLRGCQNDNLRGCQGGSGLDKTENMVYNLLSSDPQHIDELCEEAGMGISDVSRILLNLEMKRFVRQLPGKNFVKL